MSNLKPDMVAIRYMMKTKYFILYLIEHWAEMRIRKFHIDTVTEFLLYLEKTVLHLIHYSLRTAATMDPRLPFFLINEMIYRDRVISFSDVYAFVHDRFKMVHRDAVWQGTSADSMLLSNDLME